MIISNIKYSYKTFIIKCCPIVFFIVSCQPIFCQVQVEGMPHTGFLKAGMMVPVINLDSAVLKEIKNQSPPDGKYKVNKISQLVNANVDFFSHALMIEEGDELIYKLSLEAKGAKSLGVLFDRYNVPEGVKVFIIDTSGNFKGAFTKLNNKNYGSLMVSPVRGEKITIEVQMNKNKSGIPELSIGAITYGFYSLKDALQQSEISSGSCNFDVNCSDNPEIKKIKQSVVYVEGADGTQCTGTLLNNTENDGKAYVLTANHCIGSYAAARNCIFYFNYESISCNGIYNFDFKSVSGSELKATKKSLDFTLVELTVEPPYQYAPYYAGWSLDTVNINHTYSIHHPQEDLKKISIDNDPPIIDSREGYENRSLFRIAKWDLGTTEGGSSGAALFDQNFRVIGDLSGGDAVCGNEINDFYVQFARAWNDFPDSSSQLKYWLDPKNNNPLYVIGHDPFDEFKQHNYQPGNIDYAQEKLMLEKTPGWGYISGHNSETFTAYAEYYNINISETNLIGFYVNVAKANRLSLSGKVRLQVWKDNLHDSSVIYSKYVGIEYFMENKYNVVLTDSLIPVFGDIYLGYRVFYGSEQDTFAVFHSGPRQDPGQNTAFGYKSSTGWAPLYEITGENYGTSLDIRPYLNNLTAVEKINKESAILQVYPNPCDKNLNISLHDKIIHKIEVYNINAQLLGTIIPPDNQTEQSISTSAFSNGLHILRIMAGKEIFFYKFIVSH